MDVRKRLTGVGRSAEGKRFEILWKYARNKPSKLNEILSKAYFHLFHEACLQKVGRGGFF